MSEWTRDRRVEVSHRALKYHTDEAGNVTRIEEKGIDVMVAIKLVRSADHGDYDVIILASHDTDLEPALAAAIENDNVTIETAGWRNCKRLKPTGNKQLRHTVLDKSHFERSRDHKDYA